MPGPPGSSPWSNRRKRIVPNPASKPCWIAVPRPGRCSRRCAWASSGRSFPAAIRRAAHSRTWRAIWATWSKAAAMTPRSICATGKTPRHCAALILRARAWPDAGPSAISGLNKGNAMAISKPVQKILDAYESDLPKTKANLARILMQGRLGGSGKLVILPVDQGFEHGPARSFAPNPPAYDPHYHYRLAIDAGLSAYAAPLGMIEAGARTFAGKIPTILKMNSANSLSRLKEDADQAVTASVGDALRLGCSAIGFTIYPGSDAAYDQFEEIRA